MVLCSAPGKLIILGEHSVVYGKEALISTVNKRCYVMVGVDKKRVKVKDKFFGISFEFLPKECILEFERANRMWEIGFQKRNFQELFSLLKNDLLRWKVMVGTILKRLNLNSGVIVQVYSQVFPFSGLGSSAALSLSLTKAIAESYKMKIKKERINNIAFEIEKFYHGTPSGADNTTSCFGGVILFKKGRFKNKISFLNKDLLGSLLNPFLVYTGKPKKGTGELVEFVRNLNKRYREKIIDRLGELTKGILKELKSKNFSKIKEIINEAQKNLASLGVSTSKIDYLCKNVVKIGGGAKLCGAGGGGVVLAVHEDKQKLLNLLQKLKFKFFEVRFGVEGVKKENIQTWKKLNFQLQEN